jgi:hypothetical protein
MTDESVEFSAELFAWKGEGGWHFVRLPQEAAEDLRDLATGPPRGFGSIRVSVRLGGSTWATSVFPDKDSGAFVLPVKKPVREAERIEDGDRVTVTLTPLDA